MSKTSLPDFSARQLRAVLAVVENRSFIAAAASLKISQPALTRTIKQVEVQVGVELFSRTTRRVQVTSAGREFAAVAERMLNDLQISLDNLRKHSEQQSGQIIVASVLSLAGAVMPELLGTFGRRYPGIQVHLREGIQIDVLDDVRNGSADFAISYVDGMPDTFVGEALTHERFHVAMPKSHPYASQKRIALESLKEQTLVSFSRDSRSRRVVDGAAAAQGFALRYAMTVNRLPTLLSLVRNGIGLAVVPASERPSLSDRRLTSRPLAGPQFVCRLGVMRSKERELTPAAAIFLVVVRRWLRGLAAARDS